MCGLWGGMAHWSNASSLPGRARASGQPIALRLAQARDLSEVAAHRGVSVRDWMHSSWILETQSGASLIAESLPQVWEGIERLAGKPLDPLEPAFIAHLENAGRRRR
ncbi:hypothetical protein [Methylobacterium sp. C1]|uniref:hypothetical protein n=1 Tax=Methylobacterium sp. C1 TaxID=1479019 RepID=UPI0013315915|nr:hypothetical protein [Methylobacterium sp. C1]